MSNVEIVWEPPPDKPTNVASKYAQALQEIKDAPGQWARLRTFDKSSRASNAKATIAKRLRGDERWELVTQRVANGVDEWGLWVRYRTPEQVREVKTTTRRK